MIYPLIYTVYGSVFGRMAQYQTAAHHEKNLNATVDSRERSGLSFPSRRGPEPPAAEKREDNMKNMQTVVTTQTEAQPGDLARGMANAPKNNAPTPKPDTPTPAPQPAPDAPLTGAMILNKLGRIVFTLANTNKIYEDKATGRKSKKLVNFAIHLPGLPLYLQGGVSAVQEKGDKKPTPVASFVGNPQTRKSSLGGDGSDGAAALEALRDHIRRIGTDYYNEHSRKNGTVQMDNDDAPEIEGLEL